MVIMFEGVDCSGKSTLKEKLAVELNKYKRLKNVEVFENAEELISTHPDRPNRITASNLVKSLGDLALNYNKIYLCDRGPISDNIYRVFDDKQTVLKLNDLLTLFNHVPGIVFVHCDTDMSEKLIASRGDENPVAIEKHKELRKLYKLIMPLFNPLTWNLAKDSFSEFLKELTTKLFIDLRKQIRDKSETK